MVCGLLDVSVCSAAKGVSSVNFTDPKLPRYYKASFFEYKNAFDVYQQQ
jgi:hypothetical protein